ncbi:MAG: gamma carbonic anhydrase family protein [Rickettsiales bacterium]|nr:gamma carbonic anhydrase family protein [Pseudomonadota bacterium]MDA0966162.1 gamma carbonic anhydrase family protein [Pseudomonadota bacterium]MDG4543173.1 gamma carbonic anhydrase family protein [Rickettsiales bacterium]MDG4545371.1 gamma carbonic anhydrase family protein [Rickettsiales bacterium]MDG4547820.1 gamma carbonic anhydrase family protein [Rickettsiales bacterium]
MAGLHTYKGIKPTIAAGAFVAPSADIIGDVEIGTKSGIWFGCVLRGDVAHVRVGERTNIQDGTVIHVTRNGHPTIIGSGVTIGHQALLHACKLEDSCFVGMGATIMDDAIIESGGMVAAGSLITPSKVVKKGQIWAGNPGKFFRDLTEDEAKFIKISEDNYVKHVEEYLSENKIIF